MGRPQAVNSQRSGELRRRNSLPPSILSRAPTKYPILWADQQQLDDLAIAVTKVEEETAE